MEDQSIKRLSRLTAILTRLQTRSLVTATDLSEKFGVSVRTIYRDSRALEVSGIPIVTVDGRGYSLVKGYAVPPVTLTEGEANAIVTVEQLLQHGSDRSVTEEYRSAANKIRAVLRFSAKEWVALLGERIAVSPLAAPEQQTDTLMKIQHAVTDFEVLNIAYCSLRGGEVSTRAVEPFALYCCLDKSWALIAYCRLRAAFRMFRLDRIQHLALTGLYFAPHQISLNAYLEEKARTFGAP